VEGPPDHPDTSLGTGPDAGDGLAPGPPLEGTAGPTPPAPAPRKSGLLFFCAVLALFAGSGALTQRVPLSLSVPFDELFALLLPALVAAAGSNLRPSAALGLGRRPPTSALLIALLIGVAAFVAAGALMQLTAAFLPARWLEVEAVDRLFEGPPLERAVISILAATLVPFCEEVAFRGWLLTALRTRYRTAVAIAISTALFAVLHGPARFTGVLALGALFGWLTWRAGSIWPSILAHLVNNGIGVALNSVGAAQFDVAPVRPDAAQIAFTASLLALASAAVYALAGPYRRATPAPPPISDWLVRADPAQASTRFDPRRIPARLWLAIAAGVLFLAAAALAHGPAHR
jgi:membrane protease YdiL (CAAX protease family)